MKLATAVPTGSAILQLTSNKRSPDGSPLRLGNVGGITTSPDPHQRDQRGTRLSPAHSALRAIRSSTRYSMRLRLAVLFAAVLSSSSVLAAGGGGVGAGAGTGGGVGGAGSPGPGSASAAPGSGLNTPGSPGAGTTTGYGTSPSMTQPNPNAQPNAQSQAGGATTTAPANGRAGTYAQSPPTSPTGASGGSGSAPSGYAECMSLWNPARSSREDWLRTCQQAGMLR